MTQATALPDPPRPAAPRPVLRARRPRWSWSRAGSKQLGARLVALALAVAVPAFAAPGQWRPFELFGGAAAGAVKPMGFETPGESFPGSAFYYLADEPYLPPAGGSIAGAGSAGSFADSTADDTLGGPAAHPLFVGGNPADRARALQCMTMAIYYEAATESDAGQRAVAQVVLNRVAHPAFPNTVCGVVFQGSERATGCQFSFTCDGSLARAPARKFWDRAQQVAAAALSGAVYAPVGLATHYHTIYIHPYWADSLTNITTIGAHTFYRWRGAAGLLAAFSDRYAGGEPPAAPRAPSAGPDPAGALDPIQLARTYEQSLAAARAAALPVAAGSHAAGPALPPPVYSAEIQQRGGEELYKGDRLPGAGELTGAHAQSGQWIAHP
ncbi:MAG: cell wall hydrolase [Candidatus Andeanibacterium colombiense]|uniref:Cell wall hydrolase n=1 Tax=Candidatus Andeanibacterium colombiense TaxID=3121345 RepID=A0AAJ5X7E5_9SPHN|nr:MAG: cell wall hydrolase [Sphingomonadaceae bacterium]